VRIRKKKRRKEGRGKREEGRGKTNGSSRDLGDTSDEGVDPGLGNGIESITRTSGHVKDGGGEAVNLSDGEVRGKVKVLEGGKGIGDTLGELLVGGTMNLGEEEGKVLDGVVGVLLARDKDGALEFVLRVDLEVGLEFGDELGVELCLGVLVVVCLLGRRDLDLPLL